MQDPISNNGSNASSSEGARADAASPKTNGEGSSGHESVHEVERTVTMTIVGTTTREWSAEEQLKLDEALHHFPAGKFQPTERFMHLAAQLPNRTVRDIVLRLKWLEQNDSRKAQQGGPSRAQGAGAGAGGAQRREDRSRMLPGAGMGAAGVPGAPVPGLPGLWPNAPTGPNVASDGSEHSGSGNNGANEGLQQTGTGQDGYPVPAADEEPSALSSMQSLMEANYAILNSFKSNMQACKVVENTELLVRYRDNMVALVDTLGELSNKGGLIGHMPQLPVQPNIELANRFLAAPIPVPGAAAGMGMHQPMCGMAMAAPYAQAAPGMGPGVQPHMGMSSAPHASQMPGPSGNMPQAMPHDMTSGMGHPMYPPNMGMGAPHVGGFDGAGLPPMQLPVLHQGEGEQQLALPPARQNSLRGPKVED